MNKTTDELLKILISKGDMQKYIEENSNEFLKFSLCQYLNQLLTEHGLKKGKIIADALIERSYGYQIFSGRKDMPSRDVLISFALAMKLSLLRIAHMAMLYPRVKRDSIILHSIAKHESVIQCNTALESFGEPILGA